MQAWLMVLCLSLAVVTVGGGGEGSVCLRLAAIGAELYPPGRESLWEVTIGSLAVGAAIVVGAGAGGYPPREVRLEHVASGGWSRDCVISMWTSL